MTDLDTGCVILAGGLAHRLGGGDKGLRHVVGRPMLNRVIEAVRPQVAQMVLNANGGPARFEMFGLPVIPDPVPGNRGPLAGILAGLDWASSQPGITWLLSVPSDTPFLPPDLVARLRAERDRTGADLACSASAGRVHPVIGLWPIAIAQVLRDALAAGVTRIGAFTETCRRCVVTWPVEPIDPFFNANRPEDLEEADRLARLTTPLPHCATGQGPGAL